MKLHNPAKEAVKRYASEQRKSASVWNEYTETHARINYRSHMSEPCVNVGYIYVKVVGKYFPEFRNMHEDWLKVPKQKGYPKSLNL